MLRNCRSNSFYVICQIPVNRCINNILIYAVLRLGVIPLLYQSKSLNVSLSMSVTFLQLHAPALV